MHVSKLVHEILHQQKQKTDKLEGLIKIIKLLGFLFIQK